ncbi:MAG: cyclic GMP-AMP synthase DncV-like nucleotidyltransferase [Chloroflexota bacterium]
MANLNNSFSRYNQSIKLSDDKRSELLIIRNNLRARISEGYKITSHNSEINGQLEFQSQGSFVMDTIIKPIHDDYDLDDGIYFIGNLLRHQRPSPALFHKAIVTAIDRGHDDIEKINDKATCVRVRYKKGFHIDLPIYYASNYNSPDLAHKDDGWILSNPIEFINWFELKANSGFKKEYLYESRIYSAEYDKWLSDIRKKDVQLRRIVRYLKSWGDLRREEMPCGLVMTILATNNYYSHESDAISLKETLVNIRRALNIKFECLRPTTPEGEDLLKGYENKQAFMTYLTNFINDATAALMEEDPYKACGHWQRSLGDRFQCFDSHEPKQQYDGLISGASNSKPWCKDDK